MKQIELMINELQSLIEVSINAEPSGRYVFNAGKVPVSIETISDTGQITITAVFGALTGELPSAVYNLMLNANACGAQLDGGKLAIDKSSNQILLVKLLNSNIDSGESLAHCVVRFMEVVAFWQSVLVKADLKSLETDNQTATNESVAMLSV